jgi:capsular polysaccharide transport system ATP-binding protein
VYLVDEVTAVGDRRFRQKCRDAFEERSDRSSVIIVSHSEGTIRQWCERAAVLYDGHLQQFDTVDEAVAAYEAVS